MTPTAPTTSTKPAAPAAPAPGKVATKPAPKKPAPAAAAPQKTRLQEFNGRRLRLVQAALSLRDEVAGYLDREPELLPPVAPSTVGRVNPARVVLAGLLKALTGVHAAIIPTDTPVASLQATRWEPAKFVRGWKPGEAAQLKPRIEERYTKNGAYPLKELRPVFVVSVHGDMARIRTNGGEGLGLVPSAYLKRPEVAPDAPAA